MDIWSYQSGAAGPIGSSLRAGGCSYSYTDQGNARSGDPSRRDSQAGDYRGGLDASRAG